MSTYGAKPAAAAEPEPVPEDEDGDGLAVDVAVSVGLAVAGAEALALGAGVADSVGRPLGSGVAPSSTEHLAPSMRHPAGSASPVTTNPTVTDFPAAMPSLSQEAGVTVTCEPDTDDSAFHREPSLVPDGRSNSSFQSDRALSESFLTTYWAV